jgi:DNA topoisomerase VI B subunit
MAKITKSSSSNNTTNKSEVQVQKSPAEFFAEHQAIAGFDNYGKSLYTSIRELVENGLDACEAINVLPDISIDIKEYTQNQFNQISVNDLRLTTTSQQQQQTPKRPTKTVLDHQWSPDKPIHHQQEQIDTELFQKKKRKNKSKTQQETKEKKEEEEEEELEETENGDSKKAQAASNTASKNKNNNTNTSNHQYFLITVRDNGCGMSHKAIPDLFGRVLSGSKYGVRQTRGKFGLGAKMALIWSKKSTGHPIHIQTAHRNQRDQVPDKVSSCILDIDIYKNQPRILDHTQCQNKSGFVGTTVRVLIAGNWTTYKSRIVQYLQQLAIITPYAALEMTYSEKSGKRNLELKYERRSEQMPDTPVTVKHHPASVNNIIIQQLVQFTKTKNMLQFLSKELSAVSPALAKRLIAELASSTGLTEDANPKDLTDKQITRLVQLFHQVQLFRPPDGSCLSPLGEYNLNLGIHKVLEPEFIATARDKPSAYEGHPFVIEAAVSLGGKHLKEGITVFRFANRIPLLFEGGADVATRVALTKIRWSSYKMDHKRDKIGVYVSIVSTKMPFKGTSKEYIGDDGAFGSSNDTAWA